MRVAGWRVPPGFTRSIFSSLPRGESRPLIIRTVTSFTRAVPADGRPAGRRDDPAVIVMILAVALAGLVLLIYFGVLVDSDNPPAAAIQSVSCSLEEPSMFVEKRGQRESAA
jgi:hypothetical protein